MYDIQNLKIAAKFLLNFTKQYLAAKKQIYEFQLEQLLRTLRSACFICLEFFSVFSQV